MKTTIQELIDYTTDLLHTFDSEERTAMALLDYIKTNKKAMLEKEKNIICDFGDDYAKECIDFYGYFVQSMSPERFFELTFETEEK